MACHIAPRPEFPGGNLDLKMVRDICVPTAAFHQEDGDPKFVSRSDAELPTGHTAVEINPEMVGGLKTEWLPAYGTEEAKTGFHTNAEHDHPGLDRPGTAIKPRPV